jgi:hypothetical protein
MIRRRKLILTRTTVRHLDLDHLERIASGCPTDSLTTEAVPRVPRTLHFGDTCVTCHCPSISEPCE